jgi:D-serine deaminase-like pyridoxal phosphate-dependent protein
MSTAVNAFLDIVRKSHATQQLVNQVLHQGTPVMLVCATCGRTTEHRDLKLDNICYTVCRNCKSLTTNA